MLDSAQLILIAVIVILTILLLVLGVQTFLILTEFRQTLNKANKLLDDIKSGANIAKIVGTILALFAGKNLGRSFIDLMTNTKSKDEKKTSNSQNGELKLETVNEPRKVVKRFFRRSKST